MNNLDLQMIGQLATYIYNHAGEFAGVVVPLIADFLNRNVPKTEEYARQRFFITLLTCLGMATFVKWGALQAGDPEQLLGSLAVIFTESQLMYKLYFKESAVRSGILDFYEKPSIPLLSTLFTPKKKKTVKKQDVIVG